MLRLDGCVPAPPLPRSAAAQGWTVTSVGEEKKHNPRLGLSKSKDEFVAIMRYSADVSRAALELVIIITYHSSAARPVEEQGSKFVLS